MRPTAEPATKKERLVRGIPNRAYRGRIIEALRSSTQGIHVAEVGKKILEGFTKRHERWLVTLVTGLERDGLIRSIGDGPVISRQITLA